MQLRTTPIPCELAPLEIIELKPESLHESWPFLKTGLEHILKRTRPDWKVEDMYAALRVGTPCAVAVRGGRPLGFVIYYKQTRPYSMKPELFIQAAYAIPLKERLPGDNVQSAFWAVWRYLGRIAIDNYGTKRRAWISRRRGFELKYGWKPDFMMFSVED